MEDAFDFSMDLILPPFISNILTITEDLQAAQEPPFSDGVHWLEIRQEWTQRRYGGLIFKLIPILFDPCFGRLIRCDGLLMSPDGSKYSVKPIGNEYHTYTEGIRVKYPGYKLDENYIVTNVDDREVNLSKHI